MPLKNHEIISVFYKSLPIYNPQMSKGKPYKCKQGYVGEYLSDVNKDKKEIVTVNNGERYPLSVQKMSIETGYHPTQKPVPLLEYLIKTYTNEGDVVLDNCMGSGSTCVACVNTNRHYIGFELEEKYFNIACKRLDEAEHGLL